MNPARRMAIVLGVLASLLIGACSSSEDSADPVDDEENPLDPGGETGGGGSGRTDGERTSGGQATGAAEGTAGENTGASNAGSSGIANGTEDGASNAGSNGIGGSTGGGGPVCTAETCNGLDDDCDGVVDEECVADACSALPCLNGGVCIATADGDYTCTCTPGHPGKNCELSDPCTTNPCQNGGLCKESGDGSFGCACENGYTGKLCEINIDDCALAPCKNGGLCVDGVESHTCKCPPEYGGDCGTPIEECSAAGLQIREVIAYQVVGVPLYAKGTWIAERTAPVIQNKKTLLRIYADLFQGAERHPVRALLTIENGGQVRKMSSEDLTLTSPSTEAALGSTFNFTIEPGLISANTKLSVALVDPACPSQRGAPIDTRVPVTGLQALGAQRASKVSIVMVPLRANGFLPDTSPAQLERMRAQMVAQYPVDAVELSLRPGQAVDLTVPMDQTNGWREALDTVCSVRADDAPADNVLYYGLVQPAATFAEYCIGGCYLGLSPVRETPDPSQACGLGLGFDFGLHPPRGVDYAAETFTHEVGHLYGRQHTDCSGSAGEQPQGYPPGHIFGYPPGSTISWGWDARSESLKSPVTHLDIMSYCSPTWMSEFTYNFIADRAAQTEATSRTLVPAPFTWRSMWLKPNGASQWSRVTAEHMPSGAAQDVEVLDRSGRRLASIEVIQSRLDHLDDVRLFLPTPEEDWATLVFPDGRRIELSETKPTPRR